MEKSKKMEKIKHEDFRKEQKYMDSRSLDRSRTHLRVRLETLSRIISGPSTGHWTRVRRTGSWPHL